MLLGEGARIGIDQPPTFDVVVGDFGRSAAIRYLDLFARTERQYIISQLATNDLPFFDEYRRQMFSLICQVEYFKREAIRDELVTHGCLTSDILFGIGPESRFADLARRIALCTGEAILCARGRGYARFRIVLPCNGLSDVLGSAVNMLQHTEGLARAFENHPLRELAISTLPSIEIQARTVVDTVVAQLAHSLLNEPPVQLVILGTREVARKYMRYSWPTNVSFYDPGVEGYQVIDNAIIAAISEQSEAMQVAVKSLVERVVNPAQRVHPNCLILEACTDFTFGIGANSLDLFAHAMVQECYRDPIVASLQ